MWKVFVSSLLLTIFTVTLVVPPAAAGGETAGIYVYCVYTSVYVCTLCVY